MSVSNIRAALVAAFTAGNFFTKANTAFENIAFTPGASPWAKFNFVPADNTVSTLGDTGTNKQTGFIQVDLNYPLNTGTKQISDKADLIEKAFTAGKRFAYSGTEVVISSCGRSQGRNVNGFYRLSVTAFFYAHLTRNLN